MTRRGFARLVGALGALGAGGGVLRARARWLPGPFPKPPRDGWHAWIEGAGGGVRVSPDVVHLLDRDLAALSWRGGAWASVGDRVRIYRDGISLFDGLVRGVTLRQSPDGVLTWSADLETERGRRARSVVDSVACGECGRSAPHGCDAACP